MASKIAEADLYRSMLRIRRFEEWVLDNFPRGIFYGTTHTYLGQEANAVGVLSNREAGDVVVSNHRCHGHFLAYGGSMEALAGELMGRTNGVCAGRGGSQHIQWQDFYANGILGGMVPLAAGMAMAEKIRRQGKLVIAFLGDGALGEGTVYESLNMAALWNLPIVFVLENNRYAQSTPIELNLAGEIVARFQAFGIPTEERDTTDVREVLDVARVVLEAVRMGEGPRALVIHTYRFGPHSKGDDTRDVEEIEAFRRGDPIRLHAGRVSAEARASIEAQVEQEVEAAFGRAQSAPAADPADIGLSLELTP